MEWVTSHLSTVLGGLAGVLAIIAAFVAASEQDSATAEQNRLLKKLEAKNDKLSEKDDQIIALHQKSQDFFSGGDSSFYLHFQLKNGDPIAYYRVAGDNPVREVLLGVKQVPIDRNNVIADEIDSQNFVVGTAWPDSFLRLKNFPFPQSGNADFLIHISQLNAAPIQLVSMRRLEENGPVLFAYRVWRVVKVDGKISVNEIKSAHHVDPDFPVDADGKVDWIDNPATWTKYL